MELNHIGALNQVNMEPTKPFLVDVKIDQKSLVMEVDTGACVSLVSEQTFQSLLPKKGDIATTTRFTAYSGQEIKAIGKIEVSVEYEAQRVVLLLTIVAGTGPSILGRNWLASINWKAIGLVSGHSLLKELVDKHAEVFRDGLGKLVTKLNFTLTKRPSPIFVRLGPCSLRFT